MSEPLDRSRPLWQLVVVEGLARGRTAVVAKMHHALVDGIAAVDVGTVILDPTPEGLDLPPPEPKAAPEPRRAARVEALARLASAQLAVPRKLARSTVSRALTLDPRTAARQVRERRRGAGRAGAGAAHRPGHAPERGDRPRPAIRDRPGAARRDQGGPPRWRTRRVNDVLLAAVALMLSDYLGDEAPDHAVALVPVSVRDESERGELGNRISTVFVDLPLRGEPLERVRGYRRR